MLVGIEAFESGSGDAGRIIEAGADALGTLLTMASSGPFLQILATLPFQRRGILQHDPLENIALTVQSIGSDPFFQFVDTRSGRAIRHERTL